MCGRYSLIGIDELGNRFRIYDPGLGTRSHFNIAPEQPAAGSSVRPPGISSPVERSPITEDGDLALSVLVIVIILLIGVSIGLAMEWPGL